MQILKKEQTNIAVGASQTNNQTKSKNWTKFNLLETTVWAMDI